MNRKIWKRLLWKEWRENWLYLGVGVGLSFLYFVLFKIIFKDVDIILPMVFCVMISVVLRTATQINSHSIDQPCYKFNLPIPSLIKYITFYVVSLATPLLIGIAMGLTCVWIDITSKIISPDFPLTQLPHGQLISLSIIIILVCSALVSVVTRMLTLASGMIIGLGYTFITLNFKDGIEIKYLLWLAIGIVIAAIVGEICINKKLINRMRVLVSVILFSSSILPISIDNHAFSEMSIGNMSFNTKTHEKNPITKIHNNDYTCTVNCTDIDNNNRVKFNFENNLCKLKLVREFKDYNYPLAIMPNNTDILYMHLKQESSWAELMNWNIESNVVTKITDIPKHKNKIEMSFILREHIKDNYAVLIIPSTIGNNENLDYDDFWIVDSNNKRAKIIAARWSYNLGYSIKWKNNQMELYFLDKKDIVELPSLNITRTTSKVAEIKP